MLDLNHSRIGQLEISGNTIARSLDLRHTQAKLEGSNIKLAR